MASIPVSYITPEEYLRREREAQEKSEYLAGAIFAMAGASEAHSLICMNVGTELRNQLRGRGCRAYNNDVKVCVDETGLYTYPDLSALCGKSEFHDATRDVLLNPSVIVEVLSPSTEAYDRGTKFQHYRRIPTLQEYVLIAQDRVRVELYTRQPSGQWLLTEFNELDQALELPSIHATLRLRDVYDEVDLGGAIPEE